MTKNLDLIINDGTMASPDPDNLFTNQNIKSALTPNNIGANKILKAASPLINYVTHLCNTDNKYRKNAVNEFLVNEIMCFTKDLEESYRHEIILAARHIVCSWCNEAITNSSWGKKKKWEAPTTINDSHPETWRGENFFVIVKRCATNPKEHQDLLQLCYCCMTLGYEGIYRKDNKGHVACYTIIDKLWDLISTEIKNSNHLTKVKTTATNTNQPKIVWGSLLIISLISIITIFTLEFKLLQITKPMISYLEQSIKLEGATDKHNVE